MSKRLNLEFEIRDAENEEIELLEKRKSSGMSIKIANAVMSLKLSAGEVKKIPLPDVEYSQARNLSNSVNQILKEQKSPLITKAREKEPNQCILLISLSDNATKKRKD